MTLPGDFWANENQYLAAIIRPRLQALALAGIAAANRKLEGQGIYFDIGLAHADAAAWARQYTDTLLVQLGTTTQKVIGEMLANYTETPGATVGDLVKQLMPVLDGNDVRAWRVAVTETTRAFSEGNAIAYARAGLPRVVFHAPLHVNCRCTDRAHMLKTGEWVVVWETNKDDLVCTRPSRVPWAETVDGCRAMQGVCISEGPHLGKKVA
jgi:hypothetical protein